jgi:hypothetical protein
MYLLTKNTIKFYIAIIFLFSFVNAIHSSYAQNLISNNPDYYSNYTNIIKGFTLKYPTNWIKETPYFDVIDLSLRSPMAPAGFTTLSVGSIDFKDDPLLSSKNVSLQEYVKKSMDVLKEYDPTINFIQNNNTFINGVPAQKIIFLSESEAAPGMQQKTMEIFAFKDAKLFIISAGTLKKYFDSYIPTIQKIIDSFKFIESS